MKMILAIQAHEERCEDVIKCLESLGAKNKYNYKGNEGGAYYMISDGIIKLSYFYHGDEVINGIFTLSLETFEERYPFKIGDEVAYDILDDKYIVTKMSWVEDEVIYTLKNERTGVLTYGYTSDKLIFWDKRYCGSLMISNEEIQKNTIKSEDMSTKKIIFNNCNIDEVELELGDFELVVKDGKTYAVRNKPKYPKTYKECCDILKLSWNESFGFIHYNESLTEDENDLVVNFIKLKRCRDAYWKIAGEKMGLDKPWKPDLTQDSEINYSMLFANCISIRGSRILVFPTEEMQDAFYENFKDLIEQCKKLL